jgi:intracellular septation protein
MQFLVDLLPVIAFFAAYKLYGIYVATTVLIVAVLGQTLLSWIRHRKVSRTLLVTAALVLVFGGLTLYLRDPVFIKWKPTVVNCLFAAAFLISEFTPGPNLLERMLSEMVRLPKRDWTGLNLMWVLFFLATAALNLYVAFNYPEPVWVNFKLFGLTGLTLVVALIQGAWFWRRGEIIEQQKA